MLISQNSTLSSVKSISSPPPARFIPNLMKNVEIQLQNAIIAKLPWNLAKSSKFSSINHKSSPIRRNSILENFALRTELGRRREVKEKKFYFYQSRYMPHTSSNLTYTAKIDRFSCEHTRTLACIHLQAQLTHTYTNSRRDSLSLSLDLRTQAKQASTPGHSKNLIMYAGRRPYRYRAGRSLQAISRSCRLHRTAILLPSNTHTETH